MYVIKNDDMRVPLKVFSTENSMEPQCIEQMVAITKLPFVYKHVALMPDGHFGKGISIGGVVATDNVIVPNFVGVDIGCGMCATKTNLKDYDPERLKRVMSLIRQRIPVGFNHHKDKQSWSGFDNNPPTHIPIIKQEIESAKYQLGTLGGGNHFIELQADEEGYLWCMLHSGSRNLGKKIADEYHKKAVALCEQWYSNIPVKDLAFLSMDSEEGREYEVAMHFALQFAKESRLRMMSQILQSIDEVFGRIEIEPTINVHHNYARLEHHFGCDVMVHRKGATSARKDEIGIIPGSQGTASYIVKGLGNPESFMSCSHGAGRKIGRKEAQRSLNLQDEIKKLDDAGVIHSIRSESDLDEASGAYKDIECVMENQKDLVEIVTKLKPLAVVKG